LSIVLTRCGSKKGGEGQKSQKYPEKNRGGIAIGRKNGRKGNVHEFLLGQPVQRKKKGKADSGCASALRQKKGEKEFPYQHPNGDSSPKRRTNGRRVPEPSDQQLRDKKKEGRTTNWP